MFYAIIVIILGLAGLCWGGDRFIAGCSAFARNLGVPPLLVGLTIVGFGTSAPEIFVSIVASLHGNSGIAIGNAIGSNIANVGLVVGLTALLIPISVSSTVLKREFPISILVMFGVLVLFWEGQLNRIDGVILITSMILVVIWVVKLGLKGRHRDPLSKEFAQEFANTMSTKRAVCWMIVGLVVLPVSSQLMVDGAVIIAKLLQVSDMVIGLTIVAIGTSLPELFTSLMGVIKDEPDIAIGNVLGSNMFNLLAVLGCAGLIHPTALDHEFFIRDFPVMIGLTILLYLMCFYGGQKVSRWHGAILLCIYVGYLSYLVANI